MSTPTMRQILEPWMIPALRTLGNYDWLHWHSYTKNGLPMTQVKLIGVHCEVPEELEPDMLRLWKFIQTTVANDTASAFRFYAYSKSLALGPKLLRPSVSQCRSLEYVDANVTFDDYQQPFPVFHIELPDAYQTDLTKRFNEPCPKIITAFHHAESKYIIITAEKGPDKGGTTCIMSPRNQWKSIEDALRFRVTNTSDLVLGEVLFRIAVNFGLILTRFGAKVVGPLNPNHAARNKKLIKSKNQRKAQRAKEFNEAMMNLIEIQQNVTFYEEIKEKISTNNSNSSQIKSHWRRGHFRKQPHGPQSSLRKIVFIKPVFVNQDLFQGDIANTQYHIKIK